MMFVRDTVVVPHHCLASHICLFTTGQLQGCGSENLPLWTDLKLRQRSIMGNVTRKTLQVKSDPEVHQDGLKPDEMLKLQQVDLLEKQWMVHQRHTIPELLHPKPGVNLVKRCRRHLISKILHVDAILDTLLDNGTLTAANLDAINIYAIQREKQRILVDLVLRKGTRAQEAFCVALDRANPFLLEQLYNQTVEEQDFSEGSVQADLLRFLVSDELKCFQWVIDDHLREEDSSRPRTQSLPENHFGSKALWNKVLVKIVPTLSICLKELVTSESWKDVITELGVVTPVEVSPEVSEDGTMFRLQCTQLGQFDCRLTGLQLEGFGDLLYQLVPWNMDFLSSKGLRPVGPLFRFTLLSGRFHRLHLPHCQLLPEGGQHFLSVVHAKEDKVDVIAPSQVTESHVTIDVSGFSCFGLVTEMRRKGAIKGLVVVFSQMAEGNLFALMLPRNICLTQLIKEWKNRIGAEYMETIPDCELIPNQKYKLSCQPATLVQPESAKFVNFSDYSNFLPSFQVQVPQGAVRVELQLTTPVAPLPLIGWLFRSMDCVVWHRVVQLRVQPVAGSTGNRKGSSQATLNLLQVLDSLGSEDLWLFQYHLKLQPDPISASRLENADRTKTVDLMLRQYQTEGALRVAADILRTMKFQDLADQVSS